MDEPELQLREYRPSDLDALFQLDRICFGEPFRFSKRDMRRYAESADSIVIVGEICAELVGFSVVHVQRVEEDIIGYVTTIDVDPSCRRRGVARGLLKAAEARVREAGAAAMLLHVFTGNPTAISFYEQMGYSGQQEHSHFYGRGLHAAIYCKNLLD